MRFSIVGTAVVVALLASVTSTVADDRGHHGGHASKAHESAGAFRPEHGTILHQHAQGQHYRSFDDQDFHVEVGATLPGSAELHPLPDSFITQVPSARSHRYAIVNNRYVVVDPHSRRIIHDFQ